MTTNRLTQGFMSSMNFRRWLPIAAAVLTIGAAACGGDQAAPFEVEGTGTLTGRLFFDADRDGRFTPLTGDTLLRNVEVEVRSRGTTTVLATAFTDDEGYFRFEGLPPGTHDVIGVAEPNMNVAFCSARPVSVYRNEQAFILLAARRQCIQLIRDAERSPLGDPVTVVGVVIAAQGTYRSDNVYIQDTTRLQDSLGAVQVFGLPALGLQLGDRIEVSGTWGAFNGEKQIVGPGLSVTNKRPGFEFDTTAITTDSILSLPTGEALATSLVIGRLIRIRGARVAPFATATTRNSTITDASTDPNSAARVEIRLDGNVLNTTTGQGVITPGRFEAGKCYDIVGILGLFNNTRQIKPRIASDVVEVACPAGS